MSKQNLVLKLQNMVKNAATEHERDTAKRILSEVALKYGCDVKNTIEKRKFRYKRRTYKLMVQVFDVIWGFEDLKIYENVTNKKCELWVECDEPDQIAVQSMYDFYHLEYLKQEKIFMSAFIQANGICVKAKGENLPKKDDDQALLMSQSIKPSKFSKQLKGN